MVGRYTYNYQLTMSLLEIDFTYLEGRDVELVVNDLAGVDSIITASLHMYLRDCTARRKYQCLALQ